MLLPERSRKAFNKTRWDKALEEDRDDGEETVVFVSEFVPHIELN